MSLNSSDKLGPYEILSPIGEGGMGEVYRARDARLNRDVAIKVSTQQFSERFEREARAIAALNHPNACALYDVGPNYLVMELVEGPTLAERIAEGPIPLDESIALGKQITAALEEAHAKGITHRDLKPGNIKIRPDGTVKVLDFGLAKMGPLTSSSSDPELSPTLSMAATQAGVILGTAAYMAPEQARGKIVDKRADIWAFGVVLYEMVTGKRLFQGEDLTDTLAGVVKIDPDLSAAPPQLRRLLAKCLEKDPKKRLRDIGDAWELLGAEPGPAGAASSGRLGWAIWAAAGVLALAAAVAGYGWWSATRPAPLQPMVRLDVNLGDDVALQTPAGSSTVVLSPDATRLVYIARGAGGAPSLFLRRFDQARGVELPGTPNAQSPFFSPDGQWVGFAANGKLGKISVEGGAVVPLLDATNSQGGSWGEDGTIVYGLLLRGLYRIPEGGGEPAPLLEVKQGEIGLGAPQILPGGKAILVSAFTSLLPEAVNIEVVSLPGGERKTLVRGAVGGRYLAVSDRAGYLVYASGSTLFAVPFDLDTLEMRGAALPILNDVGYDAGGLNPQFEVARDGTLVYRKAAGSTAYETTALHWLDAFGKRQPLPTQPGNYGTARLSPDGTRLLTGGSQTAAVQAIQAYDLQRETWSGLTFDPGVHLVPVWSPDGRFVVFGSLTGLWWTRADGSGQPQPITSGKLIQVPTSIAPDGKRIAYVEVGGAATVGAQIWTVPVEESDSGLKAGTPQQFLKSQFSDSAPMFSPDGKWLAYQSSISGSNDVYVRAFPDNGGLWKISTNGGANPVWSRSAPELLYQAGDQIMAVRYSVNGSAFVPDRARVWAAQAGGTFQDLAADGTRALILSPVAAQQAPPAEHEVVLIQNFLDELKRRIPLGS